MEKRYLWNKFGMRLEFIKSKEGRPLNWLFLPGGPGLGSESLYGLVECLDLPGTLWCVDFPGDGSNTTLNNTEAFKQWPQALDDVVGTLDNVILVGHSTGGMFALVLPSLEEKLLGLVLIDSAPDASWQLALGKMMQAAPIPELADLDVTYRENPSNAHLKALTLAAAPYFFTEAGLEKGRALLEQLPYNYETCKWSEQHFDTVYTAQWVPQKLPTLIFAGAEDHMTSLSLFKTSPAFNRDNIVMREISHAGHFPWIENPGEVAAVFKTLCDALP